MKYVVGDKVMKTGGNYQASGKIVAAWISEDDHQPRYVFRFDTPSGMLHIFNETQLALCSELGPDPQMTLSF